MTTTTNTTRSTLNAVDIEAVAALVATIQESPDVASTTWRTSVTWDQGFRSTASIREFAAIGSDEPTSLGGTDTAPNPVEQLLAALGNCLVVGYAANASAAGVEIDSLRVELEGDLDLHTFLGLDPDGHAGYSAIRATVELDSHAPADVIEALHRTVIGTSPVGHTLSRAVPVQIDLA
jgi:uncharacterized OsmC-like protein